MNNACPGCGAVYAVAEKDVGRRIACKKCSAALIVAEDGLRYDEEAAASPPPRREEPPERDRDRGRDRDADDRGRDDDDRAGRKRRDRDKERERDREETDEEREARRARRAAAAADVMNKLKSIGDVPTWLYAIGLLITIYSFFAPQIDRAKIAGRQGDIQMAKAEDDADESETNAKNDGKPSEDDKKAREKRQKEYKKESDRLGARVAYASAGAQQAQWWNEAFRLLGFSILAFGSIGYLKPEQSPLKRILGGVTILLILAQVVGGFPLADIHINAGGRGG
jgi:hypothetical protein